MTQRKSAEESTAGPRGTVGLPFLRVHHQPRSSPPFHSSLCCPCDQSGAAGGGKVLDVVKARHAYTSTVADQMSFAAVSSAHTHTHARLRFAPLRDQHDDRLIE